MRQVSCSRWPSCDSEVVSYLCNQHPHGHLCVPPSNIPIRPPLQEGRHARWAQLLQAAEAAPDSHERILAVCRLMVCFCTDVMRPSTHFADKFTHILENHEVHRCQLGKSTPELRQTDNKKCALQQDLNLSSKPVPMYGLSVDAKGAGNKASSRGMTLYGSDNPVGLHAGDQPSLTYLHVHEFCSYDSNTGFWQPAAAAATTCLAAMQTVLQPMASLQSSRFNSSKYAKIRLPGKCSIELGGDSYSISMPELLIKGTVGSCFETDLGGECICWLNA